MSKLLKEKKRAELIERFAVLSERKAALQKQLSDVNAETDELVAKATEADVFNVAEMKEISDLKKNV